MLHVNWQIVICCLLCAVLVVSGCSDELTVPLYKGALSPADDPTWITIQVISIEVLKAPQEIDRVNEFRFFLVAGNEDPTYSAGLVYPAHNNIAVGVGDVIRTGGTYGLSVDEKALNGELYVYFAGIDSDQQSTSVNLGIDAVISLIAEGVSYAVAEAKPLASFVTGFVLSEISDYVQEDDIVGDGMFVLQASDVWGTGENHLFVSDNGGLRVAYRVTRSETGDAEPIYDQIIPEDYILYDDFTATSALDYNWWLHDVREICDLSVGEGQLMFNCRNETDENLVAALHPSGQPGGATGVSATMRVERSGGAVKPFTNWTCGESDSERAYHLELGPNFAKAVEFYPQENWRSVELGRVAVTPGRPHLLQIERSGDNIEFLVDGQRLPLKTVPNFPACSSMRDWGLDFYVWKDGNSVEGQLDQVSVRY